MTDDLANQWGKQYCLLPSKRDRSTCDTDNSLSSAMFKQVLHRLCENQFRLAKCCPSGTDANMWSIFDATGSVSSTCGIGVGAYLAGEGNMQCWSTSFFSVKEEICRIVDPSKATDIAKLITLPLPYHIPHLKEKSDSMLDISLESLEQQCLEEIHLRSLQFKLEGRPLKALLMELILASNGSELSSSFLERLGTLAKHHEFSIIVDEILTGARACPKLLLTLTMPSNFKNAVGYINLGKWPGIGICLKNINHIEEPEGPSRGASTFLRLEKALDALKYVDTQLKFIPSRREAVLKKLRVKEEDTWGRGLLIFVPKRRSDSCKGLKNRYLPMLANGMKIDTIPMSGLSPNKEVVDMQIRNDIFAWLCHSRMTEPRSYRLLVEKLVDVTKQSNIHEENGPFIGRYDLQSYLRKMLSSELSQNHHEQDSTSTITDSSDQQSTADVSMEVLFSEQTEQIGTALQEKPFHGRESAVEKAMMASNLLVYHEEISFQTSSSQQSSVESETVKTLLELGYKNVNNEEKHIDINRGSISAKKKMKTKDNCRCRNKDTIQDRKVACTANYSVALAEEIGLLDYQFMKGRKRLRKLKVRSDCFYPLN